MKLVSKDLEKDGTGQLTLVPEESEDMWHAYNLIRAGDSLRSTTVRKVTTESSTGSSSSNRVRTVLTISVEDMDFDVQACVLRVKGRNIQENQFVKMGAYHTLDLELNRKFTLAKKMWDSIDLERIDMACDIVHTADVAAVIMQEGLALVCLVTSSMTVVRAKIEHNIPRKRKGSCSQHDKSLLRFYEAVMQGILRHINFDVVKCILVASPGFVKDQFCEYMFQEAVKMEQKVLLENKSKFIQVHSSSGHKHALKGRSSLSNPAITAKLADTMAAVEVEVLSNPAITAKLADTKAAGEVKALDSFYQMLQNEPDRAFYGINQVEQANAGLAVETLLVSDQLFRSQDIAQRQRYVTLVESVRENGGEVKIFSSLHVSGEQLNLLTGVAAILRFPMPDINELEEESSSDED